MNKQDKRPKGGRGIEWTDYTWNVLGGCKHGCQWRMPDGSIAGCYAADVATSIQRQSSGQNYAQGFEYHYFHPERLEEPVGLRTPAKIFSDSMADLFGAWVPDEHKQAVLEAMRRASWHTFQSLTKAPAIGLQYNGDLPANLWFGASVPPTFFKGHELSRAQQEKMLHRTLEILGQIKTPVRWLSIEPLSFDVAPILEQYPGVIQWAVIGAASNGKRKYQPEKAWVENALAVLDAQKIAVFFKGNLQWRPWREEFPIINTLPAATSNIITLQPGTAEPEQTDSVIDAIVTTKSLRDAEHQRLISMTVPQLERRIAELRVQEDEIRQRWATWHQERLDRARPVYETWVRTKDHVAFKRDIARRWQGLRLFEKYDPGIETANLWLRFFNALHDYQAKCLCSDLQPVTDEMRRCITVSNSKQRAAAKLKAVA